MARAKETIASAEALLTAAASQVSVTESPVRYDTQGDGGPHPVIRQLFAVQAQVQALAYAVDAALVMAQHALDDLHGPATTEPVDTPKHDGYKTFEN